MTGLTHLNEDGYATMVDISGKPPTHRTALAEGTIELGEEVLGVLLSGHSPKGNVLNTAIVAGIQAVKKTPDLVPMCHPLPLNNVDIRFELSGSNLKCSCFVSAEAKTGFEMEALVGVTVALLTVYDMLKAVDKSMVINEVRLLKKTGGTGANGPLDK